MPPFRRTVHAFRSATELATNRPAYAAGIRASFATVVPLAIGHVFGHPEAGSWMSMGGFNGALSDKGGSYSTRAKTMTALLVAGALGAVIGTVVSGHPIPALVATFLVAFLASVLRVWGNPGISIGSAGLTVYVIALAIPPDSHSSAVLRAAFLVVGGVWSMGIALVLWPLRPYRPARLAISACYDALADHIALLAMSARLEHTSEWPVPLSPAAATHVRSALENARAVLVQLRRGRPGAVDRGERLLVLGESADQLLGHVVALGDTLSTLRGAARNEALHERCAALLEALGVTARAIAVGVLSEDSVAKVAVPWSGEALRIIIRNAPAGTIDPQYEHAAIIFDRAAQFASAAAVSLDALNGGESSAASAATAALVRAPASDDVREEHPLWDSFQAMLSPGSLIVRFALRVALVTTVAVALTEALEIKRGYWVTITVIVILQPYTGVTLTRAVQRVLGTVLGALVALALGAYFHDARSILVVATVFVACCVALLPVNYAAFSVFLTPTFVLLAEASAGDWSLAGTRVENTLLGGALALLGARLLWPSPERTRFPSYASTALRAGAGYLASVIDGYDDRTHTSGDVMRSARRAVGLATINAEESLQRALTESHGDEKPLAPALTLLAYTRRFTASVAALALARHADDGTRGAALVRYREHIVTILEDLATAVDEGRQPRALPEMPDSREDQNLSPVVVSRLDRLQRQATTLHDAVARMATWSATG
ncbi:MAG: FUSC family protein [Gemmatimonadota bacterium]